MQTCFFKYLSTNVVSSPTNAAIRKVSFILFSMFIALLLRIFLAITLYFLPFIFVPTFTFLFSMLVVALVQIVYSAI
jgi:hypothetical protein